MTDELRYTAGIYLEQERMMDKQFTASEVRRTAVAIEGKQILVSSMLRAYADLLEAQEKAMPVATVEDQFGFPIMEWIGDAGDRCPVGTKLYTHPAPSDAERLAEALQEILDYRGGAANALEDEYVVDRAHQALATHSAQAQPPYELDPAITEKWESGELGRSLEYAQVAQPPAASVTDEMVMRLKRALPLFCADVTIADARAALEAALAAQPRVTDVKVRASALLDLLESDFGQSGRDVRVEAIACELCAASLPDASWFSSEVCEARNQWAQRHEMNWLETDENHPDDFIGKWIRDKLLAAQENPNG